MAVVVERDSEVVLDDASPGGQPPAGSASDDMVCELRSRGLPFSAIARTVGYERRAQAVAAFYRAFSRTSGPELERLREQECARLDVMVQAVRANASLDPETRRRRIAVVERLRARLLAR